MTRNQKIATGIGGVLGLALLLGLAFAGGRAIATPAPTQEVAQAIPTESPVPTVPPTLAPTVVPPTPAPLPTTQPATPADEMVQLWTIPNEPALGPDDTVNGDYVINPGEVAMVWWKVSINGQLQNDCVGIWLMTPGSYHLVTPGRIRVWSMPSSDKLASKMAWWENQVQLEAPFCTYVWQKR